MTPQETADAALVPALRIADPEQRIAAYHAATGRKLVNLGIADNVLLYDSLDEHVFGRVRLGEDDIRYLSPPYGTARLREKVAALLRENFSAVIDPHSDVFATAGVSGALESLALALRQGGVLRQGDGVLVPTPCWQGFRWCFEQRPGLRLVPVPTLKRSGGGREHFGLILKDLQRAYCAQRTPPRLLVLTNPGNPLGVNHPAALLEDICAWALEQTDMHVVSDEIYAFSQIEGADPPFTSALSLEVCRRRRDRVHLVWGLGKDFGLSGFRVGFLVSASPQVRSVLAGDERHKSVCWFGPLDSLKGAYLKLLFQVPDEGAEDSGDGAGEWYPRALMRLYRRRLTEARGDVAGALGHADIDYAGRGEPGRNPAQFFLLDLRAHLDRVPVGGPALFPEIDRREAALERWLRDRAGVQLLPGETLSCPRPGYFRMCYTAYRPGTVCGAVAGLRRALDDLPPPPAAG
ncbi:pyridoxal phosphate-dependent aminotransferase [Streptomyces aidingensis]|uniref:Aminotransferase n=1 Tax=Streptomyces aidingensis TaxID=910347 RepID=A0A1I1MUX3_9ACTN|nr:pyridoxal phosphate-dependent aminotransferase [Streptomyces aidingensis]SFC88946.1 Aspartate/methionine/tyrosine aminotransferase [Streptomyces aidingensis]